MKKKIHLIMPMGGAGTRFFDNGFIIPKPLIEINGKPFLYWSTMSLLKYVDVCDLTFVVLQEHIDNFEIDKVIKSYFLDAKLVIIPRVLKGAVLTCLEGIKGINDDLPIVFGDCDQLFKCESFNDHCNSGEFETPDGAILSFTSTDPKYGFLDVNDQGLITRTAEKVAISNHAICGVYYFKNTDIFKEYTEKYLTESGHREYFTSGVCALMIKDGKMLKNFSTDYHLPFGTPEEYGNALASEYFEDLKPSGQYNHNRSIFQEHAP